MPVYGAEVLPVAGVSYFFNAVISPKIEDEDAVLVHSDVAAFSPLRSADFSARF